MATHRRTHARSEIVSSLMATEVSFIVYVDFGCAEKDHSDDFLANKLADLLSYAASVSKDYIWHKESFNLSKCVGLSEGTYSCFDGHVNCGESVEDEWFIVHILTQMSADHQDIAISIEDDDGEFLLIEAANQLPSWLKPETSKNRIFIHKGKIHLIPKPSNPSEVAIFPVGNPPIQQALELVFGPARTEAPTKIQQEISRRIDSYSNGFKKSLHHANCYVPASLVHVLRRQPGIIALAVESVCSLSPTHSKRKSEIKEFRPEDRVMARIRFTKLLYSQVLHQQLEPDQNSPWKYSGHDGISLKSNDLGYKLTVGFELLCSRYKKLKDSSQKRFDDDLRWSKYLESLKENDYFRGEHEGSEMWQSLYLNAREFFLNSNLNTDEFEEERGRNLIRLLEEGRRSGHLAEDLLPEDDDSWLDITQEKLDELLKNHFAQDHHNHEDQEKASCENLSSIVDGIKTFVGKTSDYEGVEMSDGNLDFDASEIEKCIRKWIDRDMDFKDESNPGLSDSDDDELDDEIDEEFLSNDQNEDGEMRDIMNAMEQELRGTTLSDSFDQVQPNSEMKGNSSDSQEDATQDSLDIDLNLVKNFLKSMSSQEGLAGPVSNILTSMGLSLPPDCD